MASRPLPVRGHAGFGNVVRANMQGTQTNDGVVFTNGGSVIKNHDGGFTVHPHAPGKQSRVIHVEHRGVTQTFTV